MEIVDKYVNEFKELDEILEKQQVFSSLRLFKCILGLNKTESKVFSYIMNNEDVGTIELTKKLKMDRSSIQRALQVLSNLNVIVRRSLSMKEFTKKKALNEVKKKGYVYVYNVRDLDAIKTQLKTLLNKWHDSMLKYIDNLDVFCDCCGLKTK